MNSLLDQLSDALAAHPDHDRVPAASVAVLVGDTVESAAWGAQPATLFQAASISKPVAALAALRLVARGHLDLDADIGTVLRSWRLPARADWTPVVTLRHLLCHGGALTMSGYPGYPAGAPLPSLVEILDGRPPANTTPVRVDGVPGLTHRYSGGGYVILQRLLEDVTGTPFAELVTELVFGPAGMTTARYDRPAPEHAAAAHVTTAAGTVEPVPGGWHTYPEQATAGLWCTPTDLVRFARAVQAAAAGAPGAPLPVPVAREMLSTQLPGWGLGVRLDGREPYRRFGHGGSNHGYQCTLLATVDVGYAAAAMTNSEDGGHLAQALIGTAALGTGWPDPPRFARAATAGPRETAEALAARYVGDYRTGTGVSLAIRGGPDRYFLVVPGQPELLLAPLTPTRVQVPAAGASLTFELDGGGRATALTLSQYGTEITAQRQDAA